MADRDHTVLSKTCPHCSEIKPLTDFYVRKENGKPSGYCKPCTKSRSANWQSSNKDKHHAIMRKYQVSLKGITPEAYRELLEAQGGVCAVCQRPETRPKVRGGTEARDLAIDHDHSCCPGDKSCGRCVRGLLCSACNTAIGLLQDNPYVIQSALEYLKRGVVDG